MSKTIKIILWVVVILVVLGGGIWLFFWMRTVKHLTLESPRGGETFIAGRTYQIKWNSSKIGKVGIALIKSGKQDQTKWIVKDVSASAGKYNWTVFTWETPGQDYRLSISEYPWQEGNKIDYSKNDFTIEGPRFADCAELSISSQWPFISSDYPDIKRVFITQDGWNGNLGGVEGADQKCKEQADKLGIKNGTWKALLGDDRQTAVERLNLDGIFVEARSDDSLPFETVPPSTWKSFNNYLKNSRATDAEKTCSGNLKNKFSAFLKSLAGQNQKTCNRLLAKDKDELLARFSTAVAIDEQLMSESFFKEAGNLWLGRLNDGSRKECVRIFSDTPTAELSKNYSFTPTCQNWTMGAFQLSSESGSYSKCYTYNLPDLGYAKHPVGALVNATILTGLSSGTLKSMIFSPYIGKSCDSYQKLLCVEQ